MSNKKYYWLKLKRDFFKRHDIQIIESMPNGKDYVLFYLKLLVESVDHEGGLRFNDTIPYNETMLSTVTNTNIDIVRSAMKLFEDLKMIEILDDSTIYMNEVQKMLGTETYWAEQKRKQRIGQSPQNVQLMSNVSNQEIDIELEKDKDKDAFAFEDFYSEYPKKKARADAEKAWKKIKMDKETFDSIMSGLERQKASYEWTKENGAFIPYPATWLNGKRWLDEITVNSGNKKLTIADGLQEIQLPEGYNA